MRSLTSPYGTTHLFADDVSREPHSPYQMLCGVRSWLNSRYLDQRSEEPEAVTCKHCIRKASKMEVAA